MKLRKAALALTLTAAALSLSLMFWAGRKNPSLVLMALFTGWVLSPYVALVWAEARSQRWPAAARLRLYAVMCAVSAGCVAFYVRDALLPPRKAAFIYLMAPLAAWVVIGVSLMLAVRMSRRAAGSGL